MIRSRLLSAFAVTTFSLGAVALTGCGDSAKDEPVNTGDSGSEAEVEDGPSPDDFIPEPFAACPEFNEGTLEFDVDGTMRRAEIWMSDEAHAKEGPLVFFWHGMGATPQDAMVFSQVLDDIKAEGGILVAPYSAPPPTSAGFQFPWYLTSGAGDLYDMDLADEIVACAKQKASIDTKRIHSTGFSA